MIWLRFNLAFVYATLYIATLYINGINIHTRVDFNFAMEQKLKVMLTNFYKDQLISKNNFSMRKIV